MSPDVNDPGFRAVTFDDLRIAYRQQVEALIDGGCDVLLVETIFDTLNAKAAIFAVEEVFEARGERMRGARDLALGVLDRLRLVEDRQPPGGGLDPGEAVQSAIAGDDQIEPGQALGRQFIQLPARSRHNFPARHMPCLQAQPP